MANHPIKHGPFVNSSDQIRKRIRMTAANAALYIAEDASRVEEYHKWLKDNSLEPMAQDMPWSDDDIMRMLDATNHYFRNGGW